MLILKIKKRAKIKISEVHTAVHIVKIVGEEEVSMWE